MDKTTTCKRYIWGELIAGRSVTHLSVLHAIGSIKRQQRIFDLREDLRKSGAPYEIVTTMVDNDNGGSYARYSLKQLEPVKTLFD